MKKITIILSFLFFSLSAHSACTGQVNIKELWPREEGWIHIVAEGVANMDLSACGSNNNMGLLLNFNDTQGTLEGKKMLYSAILAAHASGKTMKLCSTGCDTQHTSYSRLSYINNMQ